MADDIVDQGMQKAQGFASKAWDYAKTGAKIGMVGLSVAAVISAGAYLADPTLLTKVGEVLAANPDMTLAAKASTYSGTGIANSGPIWSGIGDGASAVLDYASSSIDSISEMDFTPNN